MQDNGIRSYPGTVSDIDGKGITGVASEHRVSMVVLFGIDTYIAAEIYVFADGNAITGIKKGFVAYDTPFPNLQFAGTADFRSPTDNDLLFHLHKKDSAINKIPYVMRWNQPCLEVHVSHVASYIKSNFSYMNSESVFYIHGGALFAGIVAAILFLLCILVAHYPHYW